MKLNSFLLVLGNQISGHLWLMCTLFLFVPSGLLHLTGALVKLSKGLTYLNLAKTGLTGKGMGKLAEALTSNKSMPGSLQTLILADNSMKGDDSAVSIVEGGSCGVDS